MSNQWRIHRIGLINYWYYDDEEFEFTGGRLLLRGSNGSGKSVTMQSFIPLLLDANRSPERLDPFGSRARKIEDYLLGEDGLGEEERTGYLYMELVKPESGQYLTIGLGMHGRRGKGVNLWGFFINDGRRIGQNFFLYKDLGDKVPLSRIELKNRLGEGGQVYDQSKDYMNMVNHLLFGFENIEDFDELIKLLVQLRTPKLSKDFKPTVIYDILNNSLQPLSDEDLRPMSEAIENMDNIKNRLDILIESNKAATRLGKEYEKYNRFILWEKARNYLQSQQEVWRLENRTAELTDTAARYHAQYWDAEQILADLKISQAAYELRHRELMQHDSFRFLQEIEERKKTVFALNEQLRQKAVALEIKDERLRKLLDNYRRESENRGLVEAGLSERLKDMSGLAEEFHFDEHDFLRDELQARLDQEYGWGMVKRELQRTREKIIAARKKLQNEAEQRRLYDHACLELERAKKDREEAQNQLRQADNFLAETREKFVENVYLWRKGNQLFKPGDDSLTRLLRAVSAYPEHSFDDIVSIIREDLKTMESGFLRQKAETQAERSRLQEIIREKEQKLEELRRKRDPEPERDPKAQANRERLNQAGTPYIPFYQAVEFREGTPEELRGRIEAGLTELGLLDALIVPPEFREKVFAMDTEMADKYLFPNIRLLSSNLSEWLVPAEIAGTAVPKELVSEVITSVLTEHQDELLYLTKTGEFGSGGLLKGKTTSACPSRFIGFESRRRYREELITSLLAEIGVLHAQMAEMAEAEAGIESQLAELYQEFKAFPGKEGLEAAARNLREAEYILENRVKQTEEKSANLEKLYQALQTIREEIRKLTSGMRIPVNCQAFEEAEEAATSYADHLRELETLHFRYLSLCDQITGLAEQKGETERDLENLRYDQAQIQRQLAQEEKTILQYQELLKEMDYETVQRELSGCLARLEELRIRIEEELERRKEGEIEWRNAESSLLTLEQDLGVSRIRRDQYRAGFAQEYQLGYITFPEPPGDDLALARKVAEEFRFLLKENKNRDDYTKNLQERFHETRPYFVEYNLVLDYAFQTPSLLMAEAVAVSKEQTENETLSDFSGSLATAEMELEIQGSMRRLELKARIQGKDVNFLTLQRFLEESIAENEKLLKESDRQLFEDILANTISKKIRSRIYHSEQWVRQMNSLMETMNTSSGLAFNLIWRSKTAENEEQLDTRELVELLKSDVSLLRPEDFQKLSGHFRSKIAQARRELAEKGDAQTFHSLMKNILDYRQWFEFQLFFVKPQERKRELTNNAFDKFSGGEKAMAMYVPLFSAVYARYQAARPDALRIISLDEAFAGVDENNIRDMFRLLEELQLNFIINSQILWGDYDTVPGLSIAELIRPNNANFVSVIRYRWNGKYRELAGERAVG